MAATRKLLDEGYEGQLGTDKFRSPTVAVSPRKSVYTAGLPFEKDDEGDDRADAAAEVQRSQPSSPPDPPTEEQDSPRPTETNDDGTPRKLSYSEAAKKAASPNYMVSGKPAPRALRRRVTTSAAESGLAAAVAARDEAAGELEAAVSDKACQCMRIQVQAFAVCALVIALVTLAYVLVHDADAPQPASEEL